MFVICRGNVKQHVMPDFSKIPIDTDEKLNQWLKFYNMSAPLSAVGTIVSKDPVSNQFRYFDFFEKKAITLEIL